MLQKFSIVFGFILFLSIVHCEVRKPYDPSTVINVYPSLSSLRKGGGGSGAGMKSGGAGGDGGLPEDCDYKEAGCAAAASNVHPAWMKKTDKDEKEGSEIGEPTPEQKLKDPKKMKTVNKMKSPKGSDSNSRPISEAEANSPVSAKLTPDMSSKIMSLPEDEKRKVHNWSSLQDMLQLLRKRKH